MTKVTGSPAASGGSPAASVSTIDETASEVSDIGLLHCVAAELIAHRRQQALRERVAFARSESREQRRGQRRQGNASIDPFLQRPSAFAGIFHIAFELRQIGILSERSCREL